MHCCAVAAATLQCGQQLLGSCSVVAACISFMQRACSLSITTHAGPLSNHCFPSHTYMRTPTCTAQLWRQLPVERSFLPVLATIFQGYCGSAVASDVLCLPAPSLTSASCLCHSLASVPALVASPGRGAAYPAGADLRVRCASLSECTPVCALHVTKLFLSGRRIAVVDKRQHMCSPLGHCRDAVSHMDEPKLCYGHTNAGRMHTASCLGAGKVCPSQCPAVLLIAAPQCKLIWSKAHLSKGGTAAQLQMGHCPGSCCCAGHGPRPK